MYISDINVRSEGVEMEQRSTQAPGPVCAPTARRRTITSDRHALAGTISAAVAGTWYGSCSGSAREVPLSVVAALSLLRPVPPLGYDDLDATVLRVPPGERFAAFLRDIWTDFGRLRPDLLPRVLPLIRWVVDDPSESDLAGAHTVAVAAVRAGQLHLPGQDGRYEIDLFGRVWQELSSGAARSATGQFFTPPDVAATLASLLMIDGSTDDTSGFIEPCVGTGGMLLAAAEKLRAAGHDPSKARWEAVDLDATVVALLAVNIHLWGLGRKVLLGVGDCLTDDWRPQAIAERRAAISAATTARDLRLLRADMKALGIAEFDGPTLRASHDDPVDTNAAGPLPIDEVEVPS